ncbi:hypothetical protein HAX54_002370 [Datura stramonium]|uniref:Uncharacterized protein n=1 Tax=Datura stramonium TaxID=4076 RepID=A0ABS8WTX5_DATST|nr:hypothetical protein [Datura stramonium]
MRRKGDRGGGERVSEGFPVKRRRLHVVSGVGDYGFSGVAPVFIVGTAVIETEQSDAASGVFGGFRLLGFGVLVSGDSWGAHQVYGGSRKWWLRWSVRGERRWLHRCVGKREMGMAGAHLAVTCRSERRSEEG